MDLLVRGVQILAYAKTPPSGPSEVPEARYAKNFPEIKCLEILPKGKEVKGFGERDIVYESLEGASSEFEPGNILQISRRIRKTERSAKR